jgi:predicted nuclease of predicted toxin-antitoxin system
MQHDWEIWLDNQLSSSLAKIMQSELNMNVKSAFILQSAKLPDKEIFDRAKKNGFIIIITKDADFPALVTQYGSPSKIIKLNIGNSSYKFVVDETFRRFKICYKVSSKNKN